MSNTRKDTDRLIAQLYAVLNREIEKPREEMDADLLEACTELILELQGKNFTLSNEEIEERVRKIPFVDIADINNAAQTKRKKIKKTRILLIAAVVAILITLLTIMTSGFERNGMHEFFNEKFGAVYNAPVGIPFMDGDDEYRHLGGNINYKSVEDFRKNESYNILLPSEDLTGDFKVEDIMITESINQIIVSFDKTINSFEITLGSGVPQWVLDNVENTTEINGILCYVDDMEDVPIVQIYFEHNGNYYNIGANSPDKQLLLRLIENLEE
ncbi:MAG: hypothetical protein IIX14_06350 [Clostridia bacterium]|nr:hypothetical protein [Clostridia bacterium]